MEQAIKMTVNNHGIEENSFYETLDLETQKDIEVARRVLRTEADGLEKQAGALNGDFIKALDLISNAKGRLIVTGMGKSGHVASKIAATMSSTWTPSFFVHPGEASHGDLGMIKRGDDVIMALSYSGSSAELNDTIEFAKRFSVPLIAMTGNPDSMLAKKADAVLLLPPIQEACPNNQAPTTSTTMMMALGDALAIALLERKNITPDQFKVFHPGGKLGRNLLKVSDVMHGIDDVPFVSSTVSLDNVLDIITGGTFGCVCVSDDKETLLGVITDGDVRRYFTQNPDIDRSNITARDMMTPNPKTVSSTDLGAEAMALLNEKSITNLPVVDDGKIVGVLHIHDCLKAAIA